MSKRMSAKREAAKEYLLKVKELYLETLLAKQRYAQDYELIFSGGGIDYSKERVDGGKVEAGNKKVESLVDRWNELENLKKDYIAYSNDVQEKIAQIESYHGKGILTRRYLIIPTTGRLRSFEQITDDMGLKDLRYTQRLHGKALDEFYERFIAKDKKP